MRLVQETHTHQLYAVQQETPTAIILQWVANGASAIIQPETFRACYRPVPGNIKPKAGQ